MPPNLFFPFSQFQEPENVAFDNCVHFTLVLGRGAPPASSQMAGSPSSVHLKPLQKHAWSRVVSFLLPAPSLHSAIFTGPLVLPQTGAGCRLLWLLPLPVPSWG